METMLIISSWVSELLILLTIVTFLTYKYFTRNYDYFKKRNTYYIKPTAPVGNMWPVISMKLTIGKWLCELYNAIDAPYFGIFVFDEPCLVIKSPELIKHILIKDFNYFTDRTVLASKDELTSSMLFWQKNPGWKNTRTKITSAFSSGKLKGMFSSINEVGIELNRYIAKNLGKLESKEIFAKFATDVIAKCAFAIKARSFEEENSEFRQVGSTFFDNNLRNGVAQSFYFFRQNWASLLRMTFFEKWATEYLRNVFSYTIKSRMESNIKGHDFVDILAELQKNKNLDGETAVAQAMQFFIASFETTSSTMSFTLYELCLQPEIQDRVREEILATIRKYDGITYEGLKSMQYLEMCIYETLRKYPVLPFLDRNCNADYNIDGTDLVIEQGMKVYIPLMALHYDEKYFSEPEKYDPERFAIKNSHNITGLYYMPFGEGPRICIGQRFGMLAVKIGLAHILSEFVIERISETPVPVKFSPKNFLLQSDVGLPVGFTKFQPTAV